MVLTNVEISRGTQGALRFLQRDPAAPFYFDNSIEACLRSFRVMVLVAPLYALYRAIYYSGVEVAADEWEIVLIESLRYLVDWLLFPVLFYEIARRRRWLDRYPRYIAALNWIGLPAMALLLIDAVVDNIAPSPLPAIVDLVVQAVLFYWIVITTRLTLGVGWLICLVLLVVDFVPSLFLEIIVSRILGISSPVGG